jgi:hypothetical protein
VSGPDSPSPSLQARTQAFLQEFFNKGEELVRDLIEENERLRTAVSGPPSAAEGEDTGRLVVRLMKQVEQLEVECAEIRKMAGSVQVESVDYRSRLDSLEREHYNLAAMYVAGNQFHGSTTFEEVVRTITEILLNFVGIGRFTLFCVDEERQRLFPLMREGGELDECTEEPLPSREDVGPLAEVLAASGPWKHGQKLGESDGALMHLRLCAGTRLMGVARLERFLPQKKAFTDDDFGLLELISELSGIGIETAWIRAHADEVPIARRALEELTAS